MDDPAEFEMIKDDPAELEATMDKLYAIFHRVRHDPMYQGKYLVIGLEGILTVCDTMNASDQWTMAHLDAGPHSSFYVTDDPMWWQPPIL